MSTKPMIKNAESFEGNWEEPHHLKRKRIKNICYKRNLIRRQIREEKEKNAKLLRAELRGYYSDSEPEDDDESKKLEVKEPDTLW